MRSEKYEFPSTDNTMLAGRLDLPDGEVEAYAVFAHCFTGTKDFVASREISRALAAEGIATLRFDFTGLGNSEGDFSNTNFSSNIEDLLCAANALRESHDAPALMIGHSLGGAAILAASGKIPEVKAVATIAAPFDPSHVVHLFCEEIDDIKENGSAEVDLYGRKFTIQKHFLRDIKQQDQKKRIEELRTALLVMHSPTDQTVGVENARMIYEAAQHPKSFVGLDGADHLLTDKRDAVYAASIMASWASRFICGDGCAI